MRIVLTFKETNDTLRFNAIYPELAEWFVNACQIHGNNFSIGQEKIDELSGRKTSTDTLIAEEIAYINTVNSVFEKLRLPTFDMPTNWHDQHQLNALHKAWGKTRQNYEKLPELLVKQFGTEVYTAYQEMNCHIHLIENSYFYDYRDNKNNWRIKNPFKDHFFDWHNCHLSINYPGHGRHAFEQYTSYDILENQSEDFVNWDNIDPYIRINLERPYKMSIPPEFEQDCIQKNIIPHRGLLPLGNIEYWHDSLSKARAIFTKNVIMNNNFSLEIAE